MFRLFLSSVLVLALIQTLPSPQAAVDELLAADRAFAAAAATTTAVPALSAMLSDDAVMPTPAFDFARGKAKVIDALNANPDNAQGRLEWTPIRGGVSADGLQGFTFGYMTLQGPDSRRLPIKYLSYWVKGSNGWRVAVYKRARAEQSPATRNLVPPALPVQLVPPTRNAAVMARHKATLEAAERAFSDAAQTIGVGAAFTNNGSSDAVNMGPPNQPAFTISAASIGTAIGEASPTDTAPIAWAADAGSIVAVWRRASVNDPWRYVAE